MCIVEMKRGEEFFICALKRKVPEEVHGFNKDCANAILFNAHAVKRDGGVTTAATVDGSRSAGKEKNVTWM